MKSKIEDLDYVTCQICGKHLKQLNNLHLRIHNISIEDYRKKYPNSQLLYKRLLIYILILFCCHI